MPPELEIRDWLPQEPNQGPPLPEFLKIFWPWYKPLEEEIDFDLTKPSVTPAEITPGTLITITCPITSACAKEQTVTAKVIIYEGSILPGHGTKLAEYTSSPFDIAPGASDNVIVSHTAVVGTIDRRDVEVEVYIASKVVKQSEWDDVYYVSGAAPPPPAQVTFSVRLTNIPGYAAGSYQYFIAYGGKHWGMVDPQGGVWTPISEPIVVADVPPSGTLQATLMAGPYKAWTFSAPRTFRDGETYRFNLTTGIIEGPGIVLTDLVIEPDYFTLGESATISVIAVNTGEVDEQYEVVFTVDDISTGGETVSLSPGESKEVSIEITPSEAGVYRVKVNSLGASFEVKEPYPPISEPELKSIEWLPENEWTRYSYPRFKGTMLLPAPGREQQYLIRVLLSGSQYEGGAEVTYLSGGLWSFEGEAIMPFYSPQHQCIWGYITKYEMKCPLCYYILFSGETEAEVRAKAAAHIALRCKNEYPQPGKHCGLDANTLPVTVKQEPQYYLTNKPCAGTRLILNMEVLLMEKYIEGIYTKWRVAKTWDVPSGLDLIVDRR